MSTVIQSRQPKGIPAGGQFAPDLHARPEASLAAGPDLSGFPEHQRRIAEEGLARIRSAGIEGEISSLEVDAATLRGQLTGGDGSLSGFSLSRGHVDVWGEDEGDLDTEHRGESNVYLRLTGDPAQEPDALANVFRVSRTRGRIAEGWAAHSRLRSGGSVKFGLPEHHSRDGRMVGSMALKTASGDFTVIVPRGSHTPEVYDTEDRRLEPGVATAVLDEAALAGGRGSAYGHAVTQAITASLEEGLQQPW